MLEKELIKVLDWNRNSKRHLIRAMEMIDEPSEEIKKLFEEAIKETDEAYSKTVDLLGVLREGTGA